MTTKSVAEDAILLHSRIYEYKHRFGQNFKINAMGKNELSARQFYILFVIGYGDLHTISEIACMAQQSNSSISLIMSKLVKGNYVRKEHPQNSADDRKVFFHLTEKGEVWLCTKTTMLLNEINAFCTALPTDMRLHFDTALQHLWKVMSGFESVNLRLNETQHDPTADMQFAVKVLKSIILSVTWHHSEHRNECFYLNAHDLPLTASQYLVLRCVHELDLHTISALSKHLMLTGGTLSVTVGKLCEAGFLEKQFPADDEDGRRVFVYVTPKGAEALTDMALHSVQVFSKFLSDLSPENQKNIELAITHLNIVFARLQNEGV